jgi:hypothetical protein
MLRVCPGRYLALNGIWIMAASMIAVFDITKAKGGDGQDITPTGKFLDGLVR